MQGTIQTPRLLLASRSPRRRELLDAYGIDHEVIPSGVDDGGLTPGEVDPELWVMALANLKAQAAWDRLEDRAGAIVIGADTIVIKGDQIIGQPANEDDARRIVKTLNNGSHRVATGVAFIDEHGDRLLWHDVAHVRVGNVSPEKREAYIRTGDWRGKAGAYNFSERRRDGWPIQCDGDETAVMGLPMERLPEMIERFTSRNDRRGARA